jgi:hypothetical protein
MHDYCPSIIFCQKQGNNLIVSNIKCRLGMNACFTIDGHGKGGGLALYFNDSIKIDVLFYGLRHIDTLIWDGSHHIGWRETFIYGEPNTQNRHVMWELLRRIKPRSQAPRSARKRPERQMLDFRELLSHCGVHDLGFRGKPWTYDNK